MTFKEFFLRSTTWWNGQTWGTALFTKRFGEFVGTDELGNRYYRATMAQIDPSIGPQRRWVVYNGEVEASKIPPGWRGWLTHTHAIPPSELAYVPRDWEKPHLPNMTGTAEAYHPPGSTWSLWSAERLGETPAATGDYVPWSPPEWGGDRDVREADQHPGTHGLGAAGAAAQQPHRG